MSRPCRFYPSNSSQQWENSYSLPFSYSIYNTYRCRCVIVSLSEPRERDFSWNIQKGFVKAQFARAARKAVLIGREDIPPNRQKKRRRWIVGFFIVYNFTCLTNLILSCQIFQKIQIWRKKEKVFPRLTIGTIKMRPTESADLSQKEGRKEELLLCWLSSIYSRKGGGLGTLILSRKPLNDRLKCWPSRRSRRRRALYGNNETCWICKRFSNPLE